jgi:Dynamin family
MMQADQFFTSSVADLEGKLYNSVQPENSMDPYEKIRNSLLFLLSQTGIVLEGIQKMQNYTIPDECKVLQDLNTNNIHSYLDKLQYRLMDKASRILVTGDLNAGKSTLCNTILRRHIVPDDQEPCTATFVEVVDSIENDGVEQVHGIHDPSLYSKDDSTTFQLLKMEDLRKIVEKGNPAYPLLKVYCTGSKYYFPNKDRKVVIIQETRCFTMGL